MGPPTLLAVSQRKFKKTAFSAAYSKGKHRPLMAAKAALVMAKPYKQRVNRGITSMFPTKKFVKLLFTQQSAVFTGTTQSTYGNSTVYQLNSLFQPLLSAAAKPQGFAEMSANYKRYKVFGAKVKIVFSNATVDGMWCGVRVQQSNGADALSGETVTVASMKRWTVSKPVNNTGSQIVNIPSKYWNIAAIEGLTKLQMGADLGTLSALVTASPARVPILEIACANATTAADANIQYKIEIEFYAQFFDRITFASS